MKKLYKNLIDFGILFMFTYARECMFMYANTNILKKIKRQKQILFFTSMSKFSSVSFCGALFIEIIGYIDQMIYDEFYYFLICLYVHT